MELDEFRDAVAEATTFLAAVQKIIPEHVDQDLIDWLKTVQNDKAGLRFLKNAIAPKK